MNTVSLSKLITAGLILVLLAGCGPAAPIVAPTVAPTSAPAIAPAVAPIMAPESTQAPQATKKLRVAEILSVPIDDQGFGQAGYMGLKEIEKQLGAEIAYAEKVPAADFEATFRQYAEDKYDVIIGHGSEFSDVALKVAPDYPDVKFVVDSNPDVHNGKNVAGITGKSWEAAYLCGMVAGAMTKSGHIGGIAGFDFPILISQMEAYKLGAQAVRSDVKVTVVYLGTFDDVSKGKEAALAQVSEGVDVIFHIADAAGVGIIQAAADKGVYAIGWGLDQNQLAPKTVLTSLLFGNDKLMVDDVKMIQDGTWTPEMRLYGISTGVVGIADFHGLVPDDVAKKVEQARQDIASGKLEVPYITTPSK
jgi:basic membrane protein A